MTTPFESAQLILKLYDLRREPLLRAARHWFTREFHPDSYADVQAVLASEHNPHFRMVIGYWDMACSFVAHGALDRAMFLDSAGEVVATYCKIEPFIAEIRQGYTPLFAKHIETGLMADPAMAERLEATRRRLRAAAGAPRPIGYTQS